MVCTSMRAVRSWGAMSRKRAPGRGFGVGVAGHRRCVVSRAEGQRRTRRRPDEPRIALPSRRVASGNTHVSLLAIDEAHCITEWGNEFRPVYRRLGMFRSLLGRPPTIALTGSATPAARADILHVLRMPDAEVVVTSFDRPNLTFTARRVRDDRERFALIRERVRDAPGASLIYTPTRRLTELVTRALLRTSVRAAPYHAGLAAGIRRRVLRAFLSNQVNVIVATSAFGMGIDKPDVRYVLHWGPPPTLESYYQEAGRAGRDGRASECVIVWRREDFDWGNVDPEMRRYVEARHDWRRILLEYFGEKVR